MGLMAGKRGLVMGVANERSIAWGIAQALHGAGAEMAFTYQGAAFGKRVLPMVEKLGARIDGLVAQRGEVEGDPLLLRCGWRTAGNDKRGHGPDGDTGMLHFHRPPPSYLSHYPSALPTRRANGFSPDRPASFARGPHDHRLS